MTTALTLPDNRPLDAAALETVLIRGDLSKLSEGQRVSYYRAVCESVGLNPLTQPFSYITLNGKLVLYALKACTDQLRKIHGVSVERLDKQKEDDLFIVTAYVQDRTGRTDASTGAVTLGTLKGEALANALMKAETKAKRRATLSICGLGMLDEIEVESIADAHPPRLVTEAQTRVVLPEGTCQVLKVIPHNVGPAEVGEVTYVDHAGVEHTHNTSVDIKGAPVALFEQLAQEACPVVITTKVTPRSKKTVIDQVRRWSATPTVDENAAIDAEIAKKEQAF